MSIDQSLRGYLDQLRASGALIDFDAPVDPLRDLAAVAWRVRNERGQSSFFRRVAGALGWQAASQLLRDRRDWATAFGLTEEQVLRTLCERSRHRVGAISSEPTPTGVRSIEERADLATIPLPVLCAGDNNVPSVIGVIVVPDEANRPLIALATLQRIGPIKAVVAIENAHVERALAAHRAARRKVSAAFVIGTHPAVYLAAALGASGWRSDYDLAGGLLGEPMQISVSAQSECPIPNEAEIAIEGIVDPAVQVRATPHGQLVGLVGESPRSFEFTALRRLRRPRPILWSLQTGAPIGDAAVLNAMATEIAVSEHLRNVEGGLDQIDVRCPAAAGNQIVIVKLRGRVEGQSKTALVAALSGPAVQPKLAIGVDDDIDADDLRDVGWSIASRTHAESDVAVIDGTHVHSADAVSPLAAPGERVGAKWFIDSTMPPLTQLAKRDTFARAVPKNLADVRLEDFL